MKAKRFFSVFAVLAMIAMFAVAAQTQEMVVTGAGMVTPPVMTYSQMLAAGTLRTISASEGGGPEMISLHTGIINAQFYPSFAVEVGGDTLVVSDHGAPAIYWLVRYFSEKHRQDVTIGYDPSQKFLGFRTTVKGVIVKVEDERNLLFLTNEYNLVKVVSADQMYNDRSVAYRSFYGSCEGLHAKLDVIYFPLSNEAILLAPAEYLPEKSAAGTVVRGQ